MTNSRPRADTLGALSLTIFFWSSAFAGIRAGLEDYTAGHLVLLRLLIASAVLGIYALATHMRLPDMGDWPYIILVGFIGFTGYNVTLSFGQVSVTAGAASLLGSAVPIFVATLSVIFLGERLSIWGWTGTFISFAGVALIVVGAGQGVRFDFRALLVLLAALCNSLYIMLQKPLLRKYRASELVTYAVWAGTCFTFIFMPGLPTAVWEAPLAATLTVAFLGIFPTALAYITWSYALSQAPASIVSSFIYTSPVITICIAWVWLQEIPSGLSVLGGVITLTGVVLVNTRGMASPENAKDTEGFSSAGV